MLCIKFEYLTDKMIKHVSDLLNKENGFDDVHNPKAIFIHATSPNETLKTAVTAEWFERNKTELGYWQSETFKENPKTASQAPCNAF